MTACTSRSGGQPFAPGNAAASHESLDAAGGGVYVSNGSPSGTYTLYGFRARARRDRPPYCSVSGKGTVADIASDANGNVYVPSHGSVGKVDVYGHQGKHDLPGGLG